MKALILVENYPSTDDPTPMAFVHARNLAYAEHGIDVAVLSFSATEPYEYQGIPVHPESSVDSDRPGRVLVSHAPNVRNHHRFLKRHHEDFPRLIFVFHGHEVLPLTKVYPAPYPGMPRTSRMNDVIQAAYDKFKLGAWRRFFPTVAHKSDFVFVSEWMRDRFHEWTRLTPEDLLGHEHVIYNVVGKSFSSGTYATPTDPEYDFLTIRSNLDEPKYCIDVVNRLAYGSPESRFLVIGRGSYFDHHEKAPNIELIPRGLEHQEILDHVAVSRCALMPTRLDAQGLMACEFATYGMPVISSDIDVCREVFEGFPNVALVDNEGIGSVDLSSIYADIEPYAGTQYRRFFFENTVMREIELIRSVARAL